MGRSNPRSGRVDRELAAEPEPVQLSGWPRSWAERVGACGHHGMGVAERAKAILRLGCGQRQFAEHGHGVNRDAEQPVYRLHARRELGRQSVDGGCQGTIVRLVEHDSHAECPVPPVRGQWQLQRVCPQSGHVPLRHRHGDNRRVRLRPQRLQGEPRRRDDMDRWRGVRSDCWRTACRNRRAAVTDVLRPQSVPEFLRLDDSSREHHQSRRRRQQRADARRRSCGAEPVHLERVGAWDG